MMHKLEVLQSIVPAIFIAVVCFSSLLHFISSKWKQNHRLPPSPPSLPIIGHLHHLGPLVHSSLHNLSTRYGPLIHLRLGSVSCIVASTPDLAHDLLKTNDLAFSYRKQSLAVNHITYGAGFAFAPYGPYWKFIKKISTVELLGNQNLGRFLPIRTREIHELLETLRVKSKKQESVNMTEELLKLANNAICQMMMSIRCSGTNSEADEIIDLVRKVTKIFGEFNASDFIWLLKNIDLQGFKKKYKDIHRRYDAMLEKIICKREELRRMKGKDGKGNDFLDLLLDVFEDENAEIKITRDNIKATILDFFVAGTDTSAITVEWTLAELMNNPKVLEKARQEIDAVVGNKRLVEESDAPNLPYIQAVIKESFRLHPPIPLLIRKSHETVTVKGYGIPAGSLLFVNTWSIGRNPQYWENPLEFNPSRFLEGESNTLKGGLDIKGQNFELLPFGTGRRRCPGVDLAIRQAPVTVGTLIQCFEWKVKDERKLSMDERGGLTAPRAVDLVCLPSLRPNAPHVFT
ncbi:hypothetical protein QVD17_40439 [Tagetes erecta]|uniref:Flavone synthase II n=1 Tax=Tagetes erecta TaxID=13708 RepID=A0AAD8NG48_TARER|nr:hypothetical protein QVD17_40439 [Tagetes erecta]